MWKDGDDSATTSSPGSNNESSWMDMTPCEYILQSQIQACLNIILQTVDALEQCLEDE
jgi:hypothetical protein